MQALLPQTIRDMIEQIGWPATADFIRAFAGKRVHIPKKSTSVWAAALADAVGVEAMEKLIAWAGDTTINVPMCRAAMRHARNIDICAAYAAGVSLNELVERHKISHRQLQNILATTDTSAPVAQLEWGF